MSSVGPCRGVGGQDFDAAQKDAGGAEDSVVVMGNTGKVSPFEVRSQIPRHHLAHSEGGHDRLVCRSDLPAVEYRLGEIGLNQGHVP